ncbi:MAG: DMT family transporter [Chloroflexi bacterium]|nr:MAG: DMT family transporter [Chloroflexota bacterium]
MSRLETGPNARRGLLNLDAATLKGVLYTFGSAACISVTFIASKQAMQEMSPLAFSPLWFAAASGWGAGAYVLRNGLNFPPGLLRLARPLLWMGLFNGLANLLLFSAINLGDPTLAAFFSRSETVYSVLLGALLLGERMLGYQWAGAALAVAGAGVMTFKGGRVVGLMLAITLVSNFFLSLSSLIAKRHVTAVPPLLLSTIRTVLMTLMIGAVALAFGEVTRPGLAAGLWIIGGAFFGPFLSYVLFYKGLHTLDLGKGAVIRSTQPLFVALYGLLLFGTVISAQQFLGGLLMLAGVSLMLWQKNRSRK